MPVKAKALLGLSITVMILSVPALILNAVFSGSILGITTSVLQIAVCALGITGAVTTNKIVLLVGTIGNF
jgi:hypothetical protein